MTFFNRVLSRLVDVLRGIELVALEVPLLEVDDLTSGLALESLRLYLGTLLDVREESYETELRPDDPDVTATTSAPSSRMR